MDQPDAPWETLKGQLILGDDKFTASVQELIGCKEEIPEIPKLQRHIGRPDLGTLFPEDTFVAKGTKGARNAVIVEAHLRHGYELKEIADHLRIHYTSVSKIIKTSLNKK